MRPLLALLLAFAVPLFGQERELSKGIIFCAYNLKNYVGADRAVAGQGTKPKPEREIEALIAIIREINPDILGVCEMGSRAMFDDFKSRLAKAGLDYGDGEFLEAEDPERHLALVSRFPIVRRDSAAKVRFTLNGTAQSVKRGFLDVTIQVQPDYRLRCVGVHLKSKLPAPEGEALLRRHEVAKLRQHLDAILDAEPATNLLCYGDFNDTKNEPVFAEVVGVRGTPRHMTDLRAVDTVGDRWTHFWPEADIYSRIDFLLASPGLLPEVKRDSATIFRSRRWSEASDHRPVFVTILPGEWKR